MEKEIVRIDKLKEDFLKFKTKAGLTIFLKPMKEFSTAVAVFCTKYGSFNNCFRKKGEKDFKKIPDGIAHYLEHKLFENEDGSVTFELFAKEKALANAETSFKNTSYYFASPKENFSSALKILLNFVQNPYFTDENVDKERGIISQEIKMNEDDPSWNTFFRCLQGLYFKSAVNLKIAGTVESIAKINKELLYECYENFYNLNNMVLIITGNFDEDEILKLLEKELKQTEPIFVDSFVEEEPNNVVLNYFEMKMAVKTPAFCIGYKLIPKKGKELLKAKIGLKILCELLIGEGSFLHNELYENALVLGSQICFDIFSGENYFFLVLEGESEKPREVFEKISLEINAKKNDGIDKKQFELVKKVIYKDFIEQFNTPERIADFLTDSFIEDFSVADIFEMLIEYSFDELLNCLNLIDTTKSNLTVTLPLD